uniref:Uncharacterized protein n=1 Tax=Sinocyclocheilus rhinocerous TaxID=307959 RepID=A0A673H3A5_9TELE
MKLTQSSSLLRRSVDPGTAGSSESTVSMSSFRSDTHPMYSPDPTPIIIYWEKTQAPFISIMTYIGDSV